MPKYYRFPPIEWAGTVSKCGRFYASVDSVGWRLHHGSTVAIDCVSFEDCQKQAEVLRHRTLLRLCGVEVDVSGLVGRIKEIASAVDGDCSRQHMAKDALDEWNKAL